MLQFNVLCCCAVCIMLLSTACVLWSCKLCCCLLFQYLLLVLSCCVLCCCVSRMSGCIVACARCFAILAKQGWPALRCLAAYCYVSAGLGALWPLSETDLTQESVFQLLEQRARQASLLSSASVGRLWSTMPSLMCKRRSGMWLLLCWASSDQ